MSDWVVIWLQVAVAFGTIGLAGGTVYLATKARNEATATEALAREAKLDRQLAWQPQLELKGGVLHEDGKPGFGLKARNSGAAPAVQVMALARELPGVGSLWCIARFGDLMPGESGEETAALAQLYEEQPAAFDAVQGVPEQLYVTVVLMCRDVLGRRFRLAYSDRKDGVQGPAHRAELEIAVPGQSWPDWAHEWSIWG